MDNRQTCVLILGMHRSGTSALAGFLNILEVNAGKELMPASDNNNEKGFFENKKIVALNEEELLPALGLEWDSLGILEDSWHIDSKLDGLYDKAKDIILKDYKNDAFFLIKDPRICILFPFWEKVLLDLNIEIKIILPFRNPLEVEQSLHKRDAFSSEKSLLLWSKHVLYAEYHSRKYDRLFTSFNDFISNSKLFCELFSKLLNYDFMQIFYDKKDEVDNFLDVNLKHHNKLIHNNAITFPLIQGVLDVFLKQLKEDNTKYLKQNDKLRLEYTFFVNAYSLEHIKLKETFAAKDKVVLALKKIIQNREEQIEDRKKELNNKEKQIESQNKTIKTLNKVVQNREEQIEDRRKELNNKEEQIESQNKIVQNREKQIEDRKKEIQSRDKSIERYKKIVNNREEQIVDRKMEIANKNEIIDSMRIKNRVKSLFGLYKRKRREIKLNSEPLVSIIIPFKDKPELLRCVIESIINLSTYKNYEIIGMNNNSVEDETFLEMQRLEKLYYEVKFYDYDEEFNFSKINNYAVDNYAKGKYIVFMNNDIEIISSSWIEALLENAMKDVVGAVGAKLYYENDTIQHAGVVLNKNNAPIHAFHKLDRNSSRKELNNITEYLAVTAALLMIEKEKFDIINGFDESLAIAYNDVDLCFNLQKRGYKNIFTPYCEAYHYESLSRGYEDTVEKQDRLQKEKAILVSKHSDIML